MTQTTPDRQKALRSRNLRLGLILGSVALVFFVGFITRLVLLKH
ncbi:cytochrome oxidase small assembly protein [Aquabacterium sp.]|nr:cytochrome oxidase small assembly protein [Aquabacterium sp.]